jgi:DNA polymerase-3 subunit delta
MKIAPHAADGFVRKPDPAVRAILVYGPDEGLVTERAVSAASSVCKDLSDPFRVVELTTAHLREDPARLADEFAAMSLMGGRRVVRVRPASEDVLPALENLLEAKAGDALTVIEAGDLRPSSDLRRLAEASPLMAAIACYADDRQTLARLLDQALQEAGLSATPEARDWIVDNLGGDRGQSRSEIEKLILYKGRGPGAAAIVDLDDAMAILGDTSELGIDEVVFSTWDGDLETLDRALDRLYSEGMSPIPILRGLQRHGARLHLAAAQVGKGARIDEVVARQQPPFYFARKESFRRQLRQWNERQVGRALTAILDAEIQCKSTGSPDRTLARRLCLQLASAARRARPAASR